MFVKVGLCNFGEQSKKYRPGETASPSPIACGCEGGRVCTGAGRDISWYLGGWTGLVLRKEEAGEELLRGDIG